jgi:uncharacterized membrane protein
MSILNFSAKEIIKAVFVWWTVLVLLSIAPWQALFAPQVVIGFSFLVFVPGFFTAGIFRLRTTSVLMWVFSVVGISLLELYIFLLCVNWALPVLGIYKPLTAMVLSVSGSVLIGLLGIVYLRYSKGIVIPVERLLNFPNKRDIGIAFVPALFVLTMSIGALMLNQGHTGTLTAGTLTVIAFYFLLLFRYKGQRDDVVATAVYFISLALLLMTSLRGDYIIGHDIQREFAVFELIKYHQLWSIDFYKDAYNACLSITLLPTLFSSVLHIADQYVYKILFQVLFAMVPSTVYLLVRQYVSKNIALASAIFFLSLSTFYTDMPFLVRQETAFIFLALMFWSFFSEVTLGGKKFILPVLFGLGMVLSHYSTTYTVIVILICALGTRIAVQMLQPVIRKLSFLEHSGIDDMGGMVPFTARQVNGAFVLFLVVASFVWSSVITDTSSNSLSRVVKNTVAVIQTSSWNGMYSGDTKINFFSSAVTDPETLLREFQEKTVNPTRAAAPEGVFYDSKAYDKYPIIVTEHETSPLTSLGKKLTALGLDVPEAQTLLRQSLAKSIQLLIVIGFIGVFLSSRFLLRKLDKGFAFIAIGNLFMVIAIVVVPVLSIEYGVLRAFQQSLMFLGLFVSLGVLTICYRCKDTTAQSILIGCSVLFFLSSTGVIGWVTGGVEPPLYLSNSGLYYDQYYIRKGEAEGMAWLAKKTEGKEVDIQSESQIDPKIFTSMTHIVEANPLNIVYPQLIRKDSYVYLNYTNLHKRQSTVVVNDVYITYEYPVEFLDSVKQVVFDNGVVRIYK